MLRTFITDGACEPESTTKILVVISKESLQVDTSDAGLPGAKVAAAVFQEHSAVFLLSWLLIGIG